VAATFSPSTAPPKPKPVPAKVTTSVGGSNFLSLNGTALTPWIGIGPRGAHDWYPEYGQTPYDDPTYDNTLWEGWKAKKTPDQIAKVAETELIHARWAMLGCVGAWNAEKATGIPWFQAGKVCTLSDCTAPNTIFPGQIWALVPSGGNNHYEEIFPSFANVAIGTFIMMGLSEGYRTGLIPPAFPELEVGDVHPGGKHFDPLGLSKNIQPDSLIGLKTAELKNGRLAMLSFLGYNVQAFASNGTFTGDKVPLPAFQEGALGPYANWVNFTS